MFFTRFRPIENLRLSLATVRILVTTLLITSSNKQIEKRNKDPVVDKKLFSFSEPRWSLRNSDNQDKPPKSRGQLNLTKKIPGG